VTSYSYVKVDRHDHVTVITLNRPEVLNALHGPANRELNGIFDAFAEDPDQWVAIITGAGDRAFCAGYDLKSVADAGIELPPGGFAGITARFDLVKPVIAAVNGFAFGGGFETALACDIIVASDDAQFALPEPRVGLAALAGGLLRLPRAIGEKRAMEIILTCRRVSAEEGRTLGFVADAVPREKLMDRAMEIALRICEASPAAVRASKEVAGRLAADEPLSRAYVLQNEGPAVAAMLVSPDLREGPLAFSQKRPPRWSGR